MLAVGNGAGSTDPVPGRASQSRRFGLCQARGVAAAGLGGHVSGPLTRVHLASMPAQMSQLIGERIPARRRSLSLPLVA